MVFILCILPCIRYPAGLAPWTLQQYQDLDKIPYQLLKQIYGLRYTFLQALIYTPVALGGCEEKSISDSIQLTKWKYFHSAIHLGGLAKSTANALIARGSTTPRRFSTLTCYTDSLLQWAAQIGLSLHQHVSPPCHQRSNIYEHSLQSQHPHPSKSMVTAPLHSALLPASSISPAFFMTSAPISVKGQLVPPSLTQIKLALAQISRFELLPYNFMPHNPSLPRTP